MKKWLSVVFFFLSLFWPIAAFGQDADDGHVVNVNSFPDGASIFIDGVNTGFVTPAELHRIAPGKHTITVSVVGWTSTISSINVLDVDSRGNPRDSHFSFTLMPALTTGPQGPVGPAGPQGIAGAQGPAGPSGVGLPGSAGLIGPQGPAGPAGATGAVGPAGAIGPAGATGNTGAPGANGQDGAVGPAGPQGIPGPIGLSITGPQGPAGNPGTQGLMGVIGPQGLAGNNGAAGAQGAQGSVGPQGPIGLTGAPGTNGAQGSSVTITIGTVITGANPNVSLDPASTPQNAILDFVLPAPASSGNSARNPWQGVWNASNAYQPGDLVLYASGNNSTRVYLNIDGTSPITPDVDSVNWTALQTAPINPVAALPSNRVANGSANVNLDHGGIWQAPLITSTATSPVESTGYCAAGCSQLGFAGTPVSLSITLSQPVTNGYLRIFVLDTSLPTNGNCPFPLSACSFLNYASSMYVGDINPGAGQTLQGAITGWTSPIAAIDQLEMVLVDPGGTYQGLVSWQLNFQ